ncbi:MAG: hypothetical protein OK454_08390 [Thaumarchaeota archaeon]|nr:hypothetical protein [Nitrososphaerota archaeon]
MYPETRPQWGVFHQSPQVSTDLTISTTANLPKKRRVTVSGANEAPLALRGTGPSIPASLRGLHTSATPETLEQLKLALTLKQQQKALIHARRTGKAIPSVASGTTLGAIGAGTSRSGAVTPEPALTHMIRVPNRD